MPHLIRDACLLVAVTVAVHAGGLTLLLRSATRLRTSAAMGFWPVTGMLIRLALSLILIHLTEISVWALYYLWRGCLPDAEAAFYYSGITYATIGYGEIVLAKPWRLLAPIEGLTGILMCSSSAGLYFAVVSRINGSRRTEDAGASDDATS